MNIGEMGERKFVHDVNRYSYNVCAFSYLTAMLTRALEQGWQLRRHRPNYFGKKIKIQNDLFT